MLTASLGGSVHGAALLWLQARLPSYQPIVTWLSPLRLRSVYGAALLWPQALFPSYHPPVTWLPPLFPRRRAALAGLCVARGTVCYLFITPTRRVRGAGSSSATWVPWRCSERCCYYPLP